MIMTGCVRCRGKADGFCRKCKLEFGIATMDEIHIVFDGPSSHESGRFVEVEDAEGHGLKRGRWIERDGFWRLVLTPRDFNAKA